jgi:hypothetical protein
LGSRGGGARAWERTARRAGRALASALIAERLRANVGWLAQAALATAAAWVPAQQILGHERPFFEPMAALIGVSVSLGTAGAGRAARSL